MPNRLDLGFSLNTMEMLTTIPEIIMVTILQVRALGHSVGVFKPKPIVVQEQT